jgi:two-component system sensor kinase FixL
MSPTLSILILDDDPADVALIVGELRQSKVQYEPRWVSSADEFLNALDSPPDIILADYAMPGLSGIDALEQLKRCNREIPLIVLTDELGDEAASNCMKAGAADYILKYNLDRLGPAITNAIEIQRLKIGREAAEGALLESLQRYERMIEGSRDAIVTKTLDGVVTSWNPAAEELFGHLAAEIVGRPISVVIPPHLHAEERTILDRIRRGDRIDNYETARLRKNGEEIYVSLSISPIRNGSGKIVGVSKIARDITEKKIMRARLDEAEAELRHVSRLSAMSEMSTALAHELNQPLSAIANYLGGVERILNNHPNDFSPKAVEGLNKALQQTLRAGDIIRRLRGFVASGESLRAAHSLLELVEETAELALVGARQSGVRVRVELDSNADLVFVDKVQIQQVLLNLIRNAVEAMGESQRRELTISSAAAADGMVEICVCDTGPGLAAIVAANLFQSFVTTKPKGMGLGLSICRTIIEGQGGRIWASTNPSGGTVFHLTVPLATADELGDAG